MEPIARFVVERARVVLAVTALLSLTALAMLPRVAFDADVTAFLVESSDEGRAFAELQARYGAGDPVTVLLRRDDGGTFTDREGMVLLAHARDALAASDGAASVGSFLPEERPLVGGPLDADALAALPAPLLVPLRATPGAELLLGDEGRSTMLVVQPSGDPIAAARTLMEAPLPEGLSATFAGNPVVYAEIVGLLSWFLLAIPPAVFVLLMIVFTVGLGGPRRAALAMVPAVLGSLWTFGALFALGLQVDLVTVIVPIFVIVMGSADGLHFVSHLQDAAARGVERTAAVASALREVGVPMILTTVSTAAGFLSLLATGVPPLRQLGVFVAIGITFAGAISFFFLPALMSRLTLAPTRRAARRARGLSAAVVALARPRWPVWALVAALAGFAALFTPRLEVEADPLFFFPHDHPVRAGFEAVAETFGGATPLFGEFALDPDAPLEPQLEELRALSRELEALPGVQRVLSLADVLPRVPAARREALLAGEVELPFGPMASDTGLRFVFLPGPYGPDDLAAWRGAAAEEPRIRLLTGTPLLFASLGRRVAGAQASSLALAFVLVAALLWITYRRAGRALLALAPVSLTVAVVLAFLAATDMQLNLITVIASSIVLGVGIDYAIHLVAAIEHARRDDPQRPGWVRRGLDAAGRPIVANALGIAIGLTALQLSPLRPHHHISALMWVAMTVAALTTLLLIPAASPRLGLAPDATPRSDVQRGTGPDPGRPAPPSAP